LAALTALAAPAAGRGPGAGRTAVLLALVPGVAGTLALRRLAAGHARAAPEGGGEGPRTEHAPRAAPPGA
ncbi:hypothetical protein ACFXA3_41295, partial [Streptomyces sp. NPDC059456]